MQASMDDELETDLGGRSQELLAQLLLLEVSELAKVLICILRAHPALMALLRYLEAKGSFKAEAPGTNSGKTCSNGSEVEHVLTTKTALAIEEDERFEVKHDRNPDGKHDRNPDATMQITEISRGPFMDRYRKDPNRNPHNVSSGRLPNSNLGCKQRLRQAARNKTSHEEVERVGSFFDNIDVIDDKCVRKHLTATQEKFNPMDIYGTAPVKDSHRKALSDKDDHKVPYEQEDYKQQITTPKQREDVLPVIQFGSHTYFCEEDESHVVVDVYRHGDTYKPSTVHFETRDLTAKAGIRYRQQQGKLTFFKGEKVKEIRVAILDNHLFDATLEFDVLLSNPGNAVLGRFFHRCSVKVIDDETFPTDRFHDLIMTGKVDTIPDRLLFFEYCKLNYQQPTIRKGTLKSIAIDVGHNLYFIWQINMMRYLIDKVVNLEEDAENLPIPGRRDMVLVTMMAFIVAPLGLLHFLDIRRLTWKVGGSARTLLRANLLRKFLNYDEESRNKMQASELIMTMTRDTDEVIEKGYGKLVPLAKNLGRLGLIFMQQVLMPFAYFESPEPVIVLAMIAFPVLVFLFLGKREHVTDVSMQHVNHRENSMVSNTQEALLNYRLIADYGQQAHFLTLCERSIGKLNQAIVDNSIITTHNKYFAKWISTIIVALYTLYGGWEVVTENLLLGDFIVNIQIFKEIGKSWGDVYGNVLDMQSVIPALRDIVTFMSHPIDVRRRMRLNRQRLDFGRKSFSQSPSPRMFTSDVDSRTFELDVLPLQIVDMSYSHVHMDDQEALKTHGTGVTGTFQIMQGSMVALVSNRSGGGKTTMLKIIGGVLLPESGVCIPPHLRVLHISEQPLFFEGTLRKNLLFGVVDSSHCDSHSDDDNMQRVVAICRKLLVPESLITEILNEHDLDDKEYREDFMYWGSILSLTQKALLHLARAFISNPEVLCIHRPTRSFDRGMPEFMNTLHVLREFVDEKGLENDSNTKYLRRPRTCIVTAGRAAGSDVFDKVFQVDGINGVKEMQKEELT